MNTKKILNIGLIAHVDAGKTTLTEQMLYLSGVLRSAGSVDSGTAQTDWLEIEKTRGISVRSSSASLLWGDTQINLIDTPGHVDFAGEVQRSLSVLDGAVLLLSAAEGIQAQTQVLWDAIQSLKLPTLLFINKIDRVGTDLPKLLEEIRRQFSSQLAVLETVEGEGTRECSVSPLSWDDGPLYDSLIELTAEQEEEIGLLFLEDKPIPPQKVRDAFLRQVAQGQAYPLLFGAASQSIGIRELLDAVVSLLPKADSDPDKPLFGVVYKIEHQQGMGKAAHVRLFSGSLKNRDIVPLQKREGIQKVTQIRRIMAHRSLDEGYLQAGDIGALYGLSQVRTGDLIGEGVLPHGVDLAVPLLKVQIMARSPEKTSALVEAVGELSEEDPLLDMEWEAETRELYLKITGKMQLEVLEALLRERFQLEADFSPPTVIYKETPSQKGVGYEAYTMPKPCWAVVRLAIEPLPRGSGLVYTSETQDRDILQRYQNHIAVSVPQALQQGLYGWEVTDLKVTLIGGGHHLIHTHPLDFFVATPMAIMNGLEQTGTTLLEPMTNMRIHAQEEHTGRILSDILAMRGTFDTPVARDGSVTVEARLPVASSLDYPVTLGILTGGRGTVSTQFDGYQECSLELGATAKRRGIDPRDRAKWILHARNAL